MIDDKGRTWFTCARPAGREAPRSAGKAPDNPSAKLFPVTKAGRAL